MSSVLALCLSLTLRSFETWRSDEERDQLRAEAMALTSFLALD